MDFKQFLPLILHYIISTRVQLLIFELSSSNADRSDDPPSNAAACLRFGQTVRARVLAGAGGPANRRGRQGRCPQGVRPGCAQQDPADERRVPVSVLCSNPPIQLAIMPKDWRIPSHVLLDYCLQQNQVVTACGFTGPTFRSVSAPSTIAPAVIALNRFNTSTTSSLQKIMSFFPKN